MKELGRLSDIRYMIRSAIDSTQFTFYTLDEILLKQSCTMSLNKMFKTVDVLCKTNDVVNIVLHWRQNVVERMWEINTRYTVLNVNCKQTIVTK